MHNYNYHHSKKLSRNSSSRKFGRFFVAQINRSRHLLLPHHGPGLDIPWPNVSLHRGHKLEKIASIRACLSDPCIHGFNKGLHWIIR